MQPLGRRTIAALNRKQRHVASKTDKTKLVLPPLPDFNDAVIQKVVIGPRREVTLLVQLLVWENSVGHHTPAITVRFGGIVNFDEVKAFFDIPHYRRSELCGIIYDKQQSSKPGNLFLELLYERVEARVIIQCSSFIITETEQPAV